MAAFRDANLLIISLSAHAQTIQAGVGVSPETIAPPSFTLKTIVYLKPELLKPGSTKKWSDYSFEPKPGLIPLQIFNYNNNSHGQISEKNERFEPWVSDWKALDAFFRYLFFNCLKLPKPPLAQHILLSIPPNIPNSTRDKLTQLFFENLQAPALFLIESPLLHLLGCNATSGITIDIGLRSTLVGYISDTILLNHCCHTYPVGEEDCDNFLISLLLTSDPDLPSRLNLESENSPEALYQALSSLVSNLKSDGHVRFEPSSDTLGSLTLRSNDEEEESGITDVAQAIVSGKADKIIGRQISNAPAGKKSAQQGKKLHAEVLKETDTIIVSAPSNPSRSNPNKVTPTSPNLEFSPAQMTGPSSIPPVPGSGEGGIEISRIRHRHAEPIFAPSLLDSIPAVFSRFGLEKWSKRYENRFLADDETLPRSIARGLQKVLGLEKRKDVSQNIMITGAGGAMCQTEGLLAGLSSQLLLITNQNPPNNHNNSNNNNQMFTNNTQGQGQQHQQSSESLKGLKIPEYFSEFKGRNDWSGYLGGCIVAKLIFNDASSSKLWMSKPDYSKEGPYICRKVVGLNSYS